jgi:hypothetical protein
MRKASRADTVLKLAAERELTSGVQQLFTLLPQISVTSAGDFDLSAASSATLMLLASNADTVAGAMNRGLSTLGALIAYSAPELEDGTLGAESIEAIGWLLSELGALNAVCADLSMRCHHAAARRDVSPR